MGNAYQTSEPLQPFPSRFMDCYMTGGPWSAGPLTLELTPGSLSCNDYLNNKCLIPYALYNQ